MNTATRDKLTKRLDSLEQRRQPERPTIVFAIVEPTTDGPVPTGETVTWRPGQ